MWPCFEALRITAQKSKKIPLPWGVHSLSCDAIYFNHSVNTPVSHGVCSYPFFSPHWRVLHETRLYSLEGSCYPRASHLSGLTLCYTRSKHDSFSKGWMTDADESWDLSWLFSAAKRTGVYSKLITEASLIVVGEQQAPLRGTLLFLSWFILDICLGSPCLLRMPVAFCWYQ